MNRGCTVQYGDFATNNLHDPHFVKDAEFSKAGSYTSIFTTEKQTLARIYPKPSHIAASGTSPAKVGRCTFSASVPDCPTCSLAVVCLRPCCPSLVRRKLCSPHLSSSRPFSSLCSRFSTWAHSSPPAAAPATATSLFPPSLPSFPSTSPSARRRRKSSPALSTPSNA